MRIPRSILILLISLVILTSCDATEVQQSGDLTLVTDQDSYTLNESTTITVTATNNSSQILYYNQCLDATIHEMRDSEPRPGTGFVRCLCICVTELAPESSVPLAIALGGTNMQTIKTGTPYTIRIAFHKNPPLNDLLDEELLFTGEFVFE